jgi:hypothetical protein
MSVLREADDHSLAAIRRITRNHRAVSEIVDVVRYGLAPLATFAMGLYAGRKSERLDEIRAKREMRLNAHEERKRAIHALIDAVDTMRHKRSPKNPGRSDARLAVIHARNAIAVLNDEALTDFAIQYIRAAENDTDDRGQLRDILLREIGEPRASE